MTSTNNEAGGARSAMATGATSTAKERDALRTDIERTRGDLGDTVEALSAKTDVKARASEAVDEAKARASEAASEAKARATGKAREVAETARRRPMPFAAMLAALGTAVATAMLIRRRRNRARAAQRWWRKSR